MSSKTKTADFLGHIPEDDRNQLVALTRAAAISMAALWDGMGAHEGEQGQFDGTVDMVSMLAAQCDSPPTLDDVSDENIWEAIKTCWDRVR